MNIAIIGVGGIGSFFIEELIECVEQEQIDAFTEITIADEDIVELNQRKYQNFKIDEVGKNKAEALAKRYCEFGIKALPIRIESEEQLKEYDMIILCVDNDKTRKLVVEYCFKADKEFLDLRATGRKIFAMPKVELKTNMKFIDGKDTKNYSCQEQTDLQKGCKNAIKTR